MSRNLYVVQFSRLVVTAFISKPRLTEWLKSSPKTNGVKLSELTVYKIPEGETPEELDIDDLLEET